MADQQEISSELKPYSEVDDYIDARLNLEEFLCKKESQIYEGINEQVKKSMEYFRVGKESVKPNRVLIHQDVVYDYLKTIQGLKSWYIRTGFYVSIYIDLQHHLRRNPIFKEEILLEIKQVLKEWKPFGLHFRVFIK